MLSKRKEKSWEKFFSCFSPRSFFFCLFMHSVKNVDIWYVSDEFAKVAKKQPKERKEVNNITQL